MERGRSHPHFIASFVGNFVAFVESGWFSLTEAQRHRGAGKF